MKNMTKRAKTIAAVIGCGVIIWVAAFLSGDSVIAPGTYAGPTPPNASQRKTVTARLENITEWYEAVGTVRPRTETRIEAQVTAQVVNVKVNAGTKVQKGDALLTLDNRQFMSRLDQSRQGLKAATAVQEQARQGLAAAEAAFAEAEAAYNRTQQLFQSQAATSQDLEQAESAYLQAKAGVTKAREALAGAEAHIRHAEEVIKEAEIALGYTTLRAPESGEVLKRMVEPGDLALPGKPLVVLQTSGFLRLEAYVREGLIKTVAPGDTLSATIDTLEKTADVQVEEIVPYADPQTRTFLVKVALPSMPGLFPGMYGKLLIPVKEHAVVTLPYRSIRRVGQLELVDAKMGQSWQTLFVKTGNKIGDRIEILSGLSGGELIAVEE